jgi:YgiT-type zinc finger domain-containing protein
MQMSLNYHNCCRCAGKMRERRHNLMARVGDEIVVIRGVPALICNTCGEVEYTLQVSRDIDAIMKEFFGGRLLARPLAAGEVALGDIGCRQDENCSCTRDSSPRRGLGSSPHGDYSTPE